MQLLRPGAEKSVSIAEQAYQLLRHELITCQLKPGERINIVGVQNKHGLSQSAVREALSRLSAEGLVEIERNRGFRATPISPDGYRQLIEACFAVEIPCVRESIRDGDTEWELNLISAYHRALRTAHLVAADKAPLETYVTERLRYYEALLGGCSNQWLLWSWRLLYAQNMRYRHLYPSLVQFELKTAALHEEATNAVLARDADRVVTYSARIYKELVEFVEAAGES